MYEFIRGTRDPEEVKKMLEEMFPVIWADNEILGMSTEIWRDMREEGKPLDDRDMVIGATAIVKGPKLLTLNERHFERLRRYGLRITRLY